MFSNFTKKQTELLSLFKRGKLKRLNILEGSVRSGKTWISLVLWAFWVATMPKEHQYLMAAKSLQTLKRNCLLPLEELVGTNNFKFSISTKTGILFGRKITFEGANDARSEGKIRGLTLGGAYCDELTLFPKDFFTMLLSRLSVPGAKLIATTNPDVPTHWLKTEYIDKTEKLDVLVMKFLIDDNTTLPADFIENIKREQTGVFYDRFILGLWKVAEGLIYPLFADNKQQFYVGRKDVPVLKYVHIGEDFGGNKSNHAFVAVGFPETMDCIYVLKSKSMPATGTNVNDINRALLTFANEIYADYGFVDRIFADCAEQTIINTQRIDLKNYVILNSIKNEILDRIRCEDVLFARGKIKLVAGQNDALERGLEMSRWDPKSETDKRLDDGSSDIDILDAFEYAFEPYIRQLLRNGGDIDD